MNILMIMTDQMRAGALGAAGHPVVKSPHLDALAGRGTMFDACYCTSPLCVPSRASMVAGRQPVRIRSYDNGSELPASVPTFMHCLRLAGWRTALTGKMHFIGPDQLHGFEERLVTDIYPASLDWTPDWRRGAYANPGTSAAKLHRSGPIEAGDQIQYDDRVQATALDWLEAAGRDERPFFLCVSFTHPHDPFQITRPYWDRYRDDQIDMPECPDCPPGDEYSGWIQTHHDLPRQRPSPELVRASRRAYYGMVSYIDDKVGQLLGQLEQLGLRDSTAVVFTSDHGEMLGDRGMWFKRTFHDGAVRVPLIIAPPGNRAGSHVGQAVSLVDLFPTILDLAGVSVPDDLPPGSLDGRSLMPAVAGNPSALADEAIGEYCGEGILQPVRYIRAGRYKYVQVNAQPPLLFDIQNDPWEQHSLAGRGDLAAIESSLRQRLLVGWDGEAIRQDILRSQQERILISKALTTGRRQSWDFAPSDKWPL